MLLSGKFFFEHCPVAHLEWNIRAFKCFLNLLLAELNWLVYYLQKSIEWLTSYWRSSFYATFPVAPLEWNFETFSKFQWYVTFLSSWIDWQQSVAQFESYWTGVLAWNPHWMLLLKKMWMWPLKWPNTLFSTIVQCVSCRDAHFELSSVMKFLLCSDTPI
jgi:hypothetical protein